MVGFLILFQRLFRTMRQSLRDPAFRGLMYLVIIVLTVGTLFYNHYEHWGWLNSLYFCVTTLTTIGLGDFTPSTPETKLFTILYIFVGLGILLAFINLIAEQTTKEYQTSLTEIRKKYDLKRTKL